MPPVIILDKLAMLPDRAYLDISKSVAIDPATANAKRLVARHLEFYGEPIFDRIEQAFVDVSGHEALLRRWTGRIGEW